VPDKDLLLTNEEDSLRGLVIPREVAEGLLSGATSRIFGQDYVEKDVFCEWLQIVSVDDGKFVGVCFTDFYDSAENRVVQGLETTNSRRTKDGLLVLLRDTQDWRIESGPYLPAYFLRTKTGCYAYLIPSAFGPGEKPPKELKFVSTLAEISEPAAPPGR
jgi:hypothetical protein